MAQCGDNSSQPSGLANRWASLDIQPFAPFFTPYLHHLSLNTSCPLLPHFHTFTHTHTLRISTFASSLISLLLPTPVARQSFQRSSTTQYFCLLPCIKNTTAVFHHSPDASFISCVGSASLAVAQFRPSSCQPNSSRIRSLTRSLTPRAVCFPGLTSACVARSASQTRLLLHDKRRGMVAGYFVEYSNGRRENPNALYAGRSTASCGDPRKTMTSPPGGTAVEE